MSGQDLYEELSGLTRLLNTALRQYGSRGATYARAEHDYRVALAKEMLIQRDNRIPVTIIGDLCRGTPSIAKLKLERDVAEVTYKAASEAINTYKLQIRIIESQIEREWNSK